MDENAFTVMPMSQEIKLVPGNTYKASISVVNPMDAKEDFYYKVSVSPYSVLDINNTADLVTRSKTSDIVDWIDIPEDTGVVKPNEVKKVEFTITVPEDAHGGGQYAAIGVSSNKKTESDDGVSVQNVLEIVSLVYADVAGDTTHEGRIDENNVPFLSTSGDARTFIRLANTGNVHEKADIKLTVKDYFSGNVVFPVEGETNEFTEIIMPQSERLVTRDLEHLPSLGVYEVTQEVSYMGGESVISQVLVRCPIWFMTLVALTLVALISTVVYLVRRRIHNKANKNDD